MTFKRLHHENTCVEFHSADTAWQGRDKVGGKAGGNRRPWLIPLQLSITPRQNEFRLANGQYQWITYLSATSVDIDSGDGDDDELLQGISLSGPLQAQAQAKMGSNDHESRG